MTPRWIAPVLACALGLAALGCGPEPAPAPVALPPVTDDPINKLDVVYLRASAAEVMRELVGALPDKERTLMASVPLVTEDEPGFVNAYASCKRRVAKMAITDELLRIQAQLARSRATDEIFGTTKLDEYLRFLTDNVQPEAAVPQPPAGFYDDAQDTEARKVARQHQLFEEELAFVMAHEIAHHYLGHTGCVGTPHPLITLGSILSGELPIFNQPFELAADANGTQNLLNAGAKRSDYKWTEGGGMICLKFFAALEQITPADSIFYTIVMSHPPSSVRMPVVTQAANDWRAAQPRPPLPPPRPR
jgi:hypothetical protein